MSHEDWAALVKGVIGTAALGLAILYFLESLERATPEYLEAAQTMANCPSLRPMGLVAASTALIILIQRLH